MLLPALEAYGAQDFRCIVVWDNGTLGAACSRCSPSAASAACRCARSAPGATATCCCVARRWCARRARPRASRRCCKAAHAPVIEFDWVPAGGPFYGALAEAALGGGLPWMVTDAYTRALLLRERDPRARFNSNMKNNLRRWQARLAAHGKVTPVRLAPGDDVARLDRGVHAPRGERLEGPRRQRARLPRGRPALRRRGVRRSVPPRPPADHRPQPRRQAARAPLHADARARAPSPSRSPTTRPTRTARRASSARSTTCASSWRRRAPRWIDSNTARENTSYGRVWKDRRTVQRVAVGAARRGRASPWPRCRCCASPKRCARRASASGWADGDVAQADTSTSPSAAHLRQAA